MAVKNPNIPHLSFLHPAHKMSGMQRRDPRRLPAMKLCFTNDHCSLLAKLGALLFSPREIMLFVLGKKRKNKNKVFVCCSCEVYTASKIHLTWDRAAGSAWVQKAKLKKTNKTKTTPQHLKQHLKAVRKDKDKGPVII